MARSKSFNKASIKDVARLANVSVTTVSHVVSGVKGYAPQTVQKVKEAIEELHYVPSYAANALQKRATLTIGVCARDPFDTGSRDARSYADRLWAGILAEADLNNYKVLHFPKSIQDKYEDADEFLNGQIDGLIICAKNCDQRPAKLASAGLPVVMVARYFDIPEGVDSVAVDESAIIEAGLSHLKTLGHSRIAYVAGPVELPEQGADGAKVYDDVAVSRLRAYEVWMSRNCPNFEPVMTLTDNWLNADLTDVLAKWMESVKPTAVFAANDVFARAILVAARKLGVRVPEQLSVLGIDNDFDSSFSEPPLTTIDIPIQEVGRQAVRALLLRLQGGSSSEQPFDIPVCDITIRESTGPAPKSQS